VGRGIAISGRPDLQEEIQDAEKPGARRYSGWEYKEVCITVLSDDDGTPPQRAVPALDEESAYCLVLVVPVPDANTGSLIQEVPRAEAPAGDPVGGGVEGGGKAGG